VNHPRRFTFCMCGPLGPRVVHFDAGDRFQAFLAEWSTWYGPVQFFGPFIARGAVK
jgi:hypothetical protein